jgi:thiamine-monophosphate kinase
MKLSDLGEDRVISELTKNLPLSKEVKVGIGDDCAVIGTATDKEWELLKTDSLIEGVHFTPDADPKQIGWKAMARAISDIAAMGGLPKYAMITIAVAPETEFVRVKAIYSGLKRVANQFGVIIVGGETSRSPGPLFLSIALTGSVKRNCCILRSGGRNGDALYVTGRLGGSIRGKHLNFIPRVNEAQWLVNNFRPNAMMDLSDGLCADLPRLARASKTGFEILPNSLPLNPGCSPDNALNDGEDFELLLAVSSRKSTLLEAGWKKQFPKLPLTRIGQLTSNRLRSTPGASKNGFDHFA